MLARTFDPGYAEPAGAVLTLPAEEGFEDVPGLPLGRLEGLTSPAYFGVAEIGAEEGEDAAGSGVPVGAGVGKVALVAVDGELFKDAGAQCVAAAMAGL